MRKTILLICVVQLLVAGSLWAQATTGSIVGRVTDPSDAVVAGARVVAQNQATGIAYSGTTDGLGDFNILQLPPGTYTVTVTKDGFAVSTVKSVVIDIDQKQLMNFRLVIGSVSTTTVVVALPTMLQTQSMETGDVISTQD